MCVSCLPVSCSYVCVWCVNTYVSLVWDVVLWCLVVGVCTVGCGSVGCGCGSVGCGCGVGSVCVSGCVCACDILHMSDDLVFMCYDGTNSTYIRMQ